VGAIVGIDLGTTNSCVASLAGRWYICFAGRPSQTRGPTAYGYAVAERVEGPYRAAERPLLDGPDIFGGRAVASSLSPSASRLYLDRWKRGAGLSLLTGVLGAASEGTRMQGR
jgi:hypothetical protein